MAGDWGVGFAVLKWLGEIFQRRSRLPVSVSVQSTYEAASHRWAFDVEVRNCIDQTVRLDTLRLEAPAGGYLRDDPPRLMYFLEEQDDRDQRLGPAQKVLPLGHELSANEKTNATFVFVPPTGWRGGDFRATLSIKVQGPREQQRTARISRSLTPDDEA